MREVACLFDGLEKPCVEDIALVVGHDFPVLTVGVWCFHTVPLSERMAGYFPYRNYTTGQSDFCAYLQYIFFYFICSVVSTFERVDVSSYKCMFANAFPA